MEDEKKEKINESKRVETLVTAPQGGVSGGKKIEVGT